MRLVTARFLLQPRLLVMLLLLHRSNKASRSLVRFQEAISGAQSRTGPRTTSSSSSGASVARAARAGCRRTGCARPQGRCRAGGTPRRRPPPVALVHRVESVGGDNGPQVVAEGDVHWRAVVQGADAHVQHVLADLAASSASRLTRSGCTAPPAARRCRRWRCAAGRRCAAL